VETHLGKCEIAKLLTWFGERRMAFYALHGFEDEEEE
jgi:hypothetical protein